MPTQEEQALLLALQRKSGTKKSPTIKLLETFNTAVNYFKIIIKIQKKIFFR